MGVVIEGDFEGTLYDMERELPGITKNALQSAALILRDATKSSLISKMPAATHKNEKYKDTLADAPRITKVDGSDIYVHILGTKEKGSRTFMTRFYENGTKKRYAKNYKGLKLKKKRYLGSLIGRGFFRSAVSANMNNALERLEYVFSKRLDNIFSKKS